ncbi:MAG: ankyrin repeat domain-containing protein [Candidatus Riflebacteria bacterium]|nr:ankyrin repeat domain-containing protein [Candidatus Riflebacteria bacterium]
MKCPKRKEISQRLVEKDGMLEPSSQEDFLHIQQCQDCTNFLKKLASIDSELSGYFHTIKTELNPLPPGRKIADQLGKSSYNITLLKTATIVALLLGVSYFIYPHGKNEITKTPPAKPPVEIIKPPEFKKPPFQIIAGNFFNGNTKLSEKEITGLSIDATIKCANSGEILFSNGVSAKFRDSLFAMSANKVELIDGYVSVRVPKDEDKFMVCSKSTIVSAPESTFSVEISKDNETDINVDSGQATIKTICKESFTLSAKETASIDFHGKRKIRETARAVNIAMSPSSNEPTSAKIIASETTSTTNLTAGETERTEKQPKLKLQLLISAAERGQVSIITRLIAQGADVNVTNEEGDTALHFALRSRKPEIATILIKAGADPNIKNKFGESPKDIAKKPDYQEFQKILTPK